MNIGTDPNPTRRPGKKSSKYGGVRSTVDYGSHDRPSHSPGQPSYDIATDFNNELKKMHFERSDKALGQLQQWVDNKDETHEYGSFKSLINELYEDGLLHRSARGARMGPRTLGKRPAFEGDAESMERPSGMHRRHVISSSTLGKAIEEANVQALEVSHFLQRHKVNIDASNEATATSLDLRNLKRQAWHLVHNHTGNLWIGPGEVNIAIGIVRSPLRSMSQKLQKMADAGTTHVSRDHEVLIPPEPQLVNRYSQGEKHWKYVIDILNGLFNEMVDDQFIECQEAVSVLEEIVTNCDLDLPDEKTDEASDKMSHEKRPEYYPKIREIYLSLIDKPNDIFIEGGALDQFIGLSWRPGDAS